MATDCAVAPRPCWFASFAFREDQAKVNIPRPGGICTAEWSVNAKSCQLAGCKKVSSALLLYIYADCALRASFFLQENPARTNARLSFFTRFQTVARETRSRNAASRTESCSKK